MILGKLRTLRNSLEQEQTALEVIVRDWAYWDDMRDFVSNRNSRFVESNFTPSIYENYKINSSVIFSPDLDVLLALRYNYEDEMLLDIRGELPKFLGVLGPLMKNLREDGSVKILLNTNSGPTLLAILPILDSDGLGPISGYFMMARYIDSEYIEQLPGMSGIAITAVDLTQSYNSDYDEQISLFRGGKRVKFLSKNQIAASDIITDINGDELFYLQIQSAMEATEIGRHMRNLIILLYILFAVLQVLILRKFLHGRVIDRLLGLQKGINEIAGDPQNQALVPVSGKDELTNLGSNINQMLISLRKTQSDLVEAKNRAEESDKLKSAFLSSITHELRTPLNHIMGFSQLISSQVQEKELKEFANQIYHSGDSLLKTIQDIIDLAFAEQGMLRPNPHTAQCFDHFFRNKTSLEEILKSAGKENDIRLVFNPDQSLLVQEMLLDATKVNQILHKLFLNAVKYTKQGSIEFGITPIDEHNLRYYVKDTGIGIAEDKQSVIFDFFRQSEEGNTRSYSGVGIGLSIAQRLTLVLGGKLYVESQAGQGACFYLDIPCAFRKAKPTPNTQNVAETIPNLEHAHILLADSDATSLMIQKSMIKKTNAKLGEATHLTQVLNLLQNDGSYACLIISTELCENKTPELCAAIHRIIPELPIIITSAGLDKLEESPQSSYVYHLNKPIDRIELYSLLHECIVDTSS
jgi:signal transduction histidine kinase